METAGVSIAAAAAVWSFSLAGSASWRLRGKQQPLAYGRFHENAPI
jgi:hypothetical protein